VKPVVVPMDAMMNPGQGLNVEWLLFATGSTDGD